MKTSVLSPNYSSLWQIRCWLKWYLTSGSQTVRVFEDCCVCWAGMNGVIWLPGSCPFGTAGLLPLNANCSSLSGLWRGWCQLLQHSPCYRYPQHHNHIHFQFCDCKSGHIRSGCVHIIYFLHSVGWVQGLVPCPQSPRKQLQLLVSPGKHLHPSKADRGSWRSHCCIPLPLALKGWGLRLWSLSWDVPTPQFENHY